MDSFVAAVADAIRRHRMFTRRDRVLVAVSGGPDSVALLAALVSLGHRVVVAHVDHRLRGKESDGDVRFVRRLGERLGVEVRVLDGAVAPGANLEARARDRRYEALFRAADLVGARRIATAHTRDDQAETVLLRLLRGAGSTGLAGIAPTRVDGVVRPMLDCDRAAVRGYLRREGLRFRSDRSNRDLRFTRNRVRRVLLPLLEREFNPSVGEALGRAARLLRDDEEHLSAEARRAAKRISAAGALAAPRLVRLSPAIARRVVRFWVDSHRDLAGGLEAPHVESILAVARREAAAVSVPGGTVRRKGGDLCWEAIGKTRATPFRAPLEPGAALALGEWRLSVSRQRGRGGTPSRWRAVFDAAALEGARLEARSVAPGTRIRPLGLGGSRKLQDVFVDAKVPRTERAGWPVVTAGPGVIWVPGLVRAERAPVTRETREVLVLEARRMTKTPDVAAKNPMCYGRSRRRTTRRGDSLRRRPTSRKEPN